LNKQRDEGMIKTEIRGQRSEVGKGQKSEIREEKCWNAGIRTN